ncbi:MAG: hypothetical protein RBR74_02215 [Ignavibacteriaceae bacterium]|jgi:hypothetical protein|nr:hypothetical protein [Ignavibacteriaceae bacterium]
MLIKYIKNLSAFLIIIFAFNFIHSEIVDQLEGNYYCKIVNDYCKLVEAVSVVRHTSSKTVPKPISISESICQNNPDCCISRNPLLNHLQNSSFNHLEILPAYLINKSLLI